jgi:hypothetical protein
MKNIKKEAAQILINWYDKVSYGDDNPECTNHNELILLLGHPVFDDKELIIEINKQAKNFIRYNDVRLLDFLSHELQRNKELVLELVKINGNNLHFANAQFTDDKEIVLESVKANPESFCYCSERLKDDDDIVNHIIQFSPEQISLTPDRFKKNKEIAIGLLKINSHLITALEPEFKSDKDVLLECWKSIKEHAIYGSFRLKRSVQILIDNMGEDIRPFFNKVNVEEDNPNLIKEIDISFNHLALNKELNPAQNRQTKKIKI